MHKFKYSVGLIFILLIVATSCSTKKNTWSTRAYHATTTRFNIVFNAQTNYDKGVSELQKMQQDDYSNILPMYPISNHDNGQAVGSTMDIVIEKCRKAIKLHSIQKKPKKNPKKNKDPEYQQWLKQTEFNPLVKKAWLLIGQAEFHKADFIGSIGTFTYITRHFATEPAVVSEARIWMARAYAEMNWFYEAEEVLGKINENDVNTDLNGLFAATKADLLMKQGRYKETIPFLKIALDKEKNRYQRTRFNYILGQLLLLQNDRKTAANYFKAVLKLTPSYTMEFNARMQVLQAETTNSSKAIKSLEKMAKSPNNKDYLDQIYYTIGNIQLFAGRESKAITAYQTAIKQSTRNGIEKAVVLLKLGDLFYGKKKYIDAQPCYEEASTIISNTHTDYARVTKLAETLGDLATNYNTVVLQDSLQYLSTLSDKEQREIVDKLIAKLIADEEEAKLRAAEDAAALNAVGNESAFGSAGLTPVGTTGEWYFYNPALITSGRTEFQRRWGKRKLEDQWRRLNKTAQMAEVEETETNETDAANDTLPKKMEDTKNPAFYLAQIPRTEAQKEQSNLAIADALLNMADIYKNKLEDSEMAETTLLDFQKRFPKSERLLESYYALYQVYGQLQQTDAQNSVRQTIVTNYPSSKYAIILSQPDYAERMKQMYVMQDSLYAATYTAYSKNEFKQVLSNYDYMASNFPLSTLMPKFSFLRALSIGKTASATNFQEALTKLVELYPTSDVASMSKDILALMAQGQQAQKGGSHGSLLSLREQEVQSEAQEPITTKTYTADKQTPFVLLLKPSDQGTVNQLLFDLAAYNFSKFLIKDFDLAIRTIEGDKMIVISNFENYNELLWYDKLLTTEPALTESVMAKIASRIYISNDNLSLVTLLSLKEYNQFFKQNFK
ncbi:MAG: tetratricopeptide repeat protein [Paludibacteraceae bacterium]|nr:tetratricopeptide repeat protein [Paludibacteraceae bacterium]